MKKSKNNKTKLAAAIAITLLIISAFTLMAMPAQLVEAQPAAQQPTVAMPSGATADRTVETIPHISFRPRTIGGSWSTTSSERVDRSYVPFSELQAFPSVQGDNYQARRNSRRYHEGFLSRRYNFMV